MANDQRPVLLLVGSSSEEPMPVLVKHSGLRMVAVNKDSVGLLDDSWDVLGVYFLFGHGSTPDSYTAYVGEAGRRPLRTRLREHVRHKEEWNRALLITSDSGEGFDSAAIGWLEGRLYAVLKNATAAEVLNRNTPRDESLPQYEREALEGYIKPIMAAMRALGYPPDTPDQRPHESRRRPPRRYSESLSDLLEAGLLRADTRLSPLPSAFERTATVLADGRLRIDDQTFDTPSGAAQHVTERATNGWDFWGAPSGEGGLKSLSALREQLRACGHNGSSELSKLGPAAQATDGATRETLDRPRAVRRATDAPAPERTGEPHEPSADVGEALSFPSYRPDGVAVREDVTIGHLYEANLLEGSSVSANYKGQRYEATPMGDGSLRFPDERSFPTLSAAGQAVTRRPTNGWTFWKAEHKGRPVALSVLRDELLQLEPRLLRSDELQPSHVPAADAPWNTILLFALRFDGYAYLGGGDDAVQRLQEFADGAHERWSRSQELPASVDELRVALFGEERRYKWTDMTGGDPKNMPYIRALVDRIRELVEPTSNAT